MKSSAFLRNFFLILWIDLLIYASCQLRQDPCSAGGHTVLDDKQRSVGSSIKDDKLCDRNLKTGWYRFEMEGKHARMPTKCIQMDRCGAKMPIWLSGFEQGSNRYPPRKGNEISLVGCSSSWSSGEPSSQCCTYKVPIKLLNCGIYFVYYLKPTEGCQMGYCMESPNEDDQLSKFTRPEVESVIISKSRVALRCSWKVEKDASPTSYNIFWYKTSTSSLNPSQTIVQTEYDIKSTKSLLFLNGNVDMGEQVVCVVNSTVGRFSEKSSLPFYVGIKAYPDSLTLSEKGEKANVTYVSTVPYICEGNCNVRLKLGIKFEDNNAIQEPDIAVSECQLNLCSSPICAKPSASVQVVAVMDYMDDGKTKNYLKAMVKANDALLDGYQVPEVQVTTEDVPTAQCYSVTDPHYMTFDGRRYDFFSTGTFMLVRSLNRVFEVQTRIWLCGTEPQPVSCNCGFAAREDNDLVIVDMCHGSFMTTLPEVTVRTLNSSDTVRAKVYESKKGRIIKVEFPSGAFIQAFVSRWGLTISVQASAVDFGNTSGLCGVFDGNPANDFNDVDGTTMKLKPVLGQVNEFVETWRIVPGESFFDKAPKVVSTEARTSFCNCLKNDLPSQSISYGRYLSRKNSDKDCDPKKGNCASDDDYNGCHHYDNINYKNILTYTDITDDVKSEHRTLYTDGIKSLSKHDPAQLRDSPYINPKVKSFGKNIYWKKSEAPLNFETSSSNSDDYFDSEEFDEDLLEEIGSETTYVFPGDLFPVQPSDEPPKLPTPKGMTENDIKELCKNTIEKSTVVAVFAPYLSNTTLHAMETCMLDVMMTDDVTWAPHSIAFLEFEAEQLAVKQRMRWPRDTINLINALNCPNMCSGHGVCLKYGCVCNPRRAADDCSVGEDQPPTLSHATDFGHCDISKFECRRVRLLGSNFIQGSDLSCRFAAADYNHTLRKWLIKDTDDVFLSEAIYMGPRDLVCQLPDAALRIGEPLVAWFISVTNDKRQYSEQSIQYTVYDFRCYVCTTDRNVTCDRETDSCVIDNRCYADLEKNPKDHCFHCSVNVANNLWTQREIEDKTSGLDVPGKIFIYNHEEFSYRFDASLNIDFKESPSSAAINDGIVSWTPKRNKSFTEWFKIKVTGECKTSTTYTVKVTVLPCKCKNNGICRRIGNINYVRNTGFDHCECLSGFIGQVCEKEIDPCDENPCYPSVRCKKLSKFNYSCASCPLGLTGNGSECTVMDQQICEKDACYPGVNCSMTALGLKCGPCPSGYSGDGFKCSPVCRVPCNGNQICSAPNRCRCKIGYTGSRCHIPICRPPCQNLGACFAPNACHCRHGYTGVRCEKGVCNPQCQNGGTCKGRNRCSCMYGYLGRFCQSPACPMGCSNGGTCVAVNKCLCKKGWGGYRCHLPICKPMCMNGGYCVRPGECQCLPGFTGPTCEQGLCTPPCQNGANCIRRNMCACLPGWYGSRCQLPICEPRCLNGGKCWRPNQCSCTSGWSGNTCDTAICVGKCLNGGTCVRPNTCLCTANYKGSNCHKPVCKKKCRYGGKCIAPNRCRCKAGYTGKTCERRPIRHHRKQKKRYQRRRKGNKIRLHKWYRHLVG